MANSKPTAAEAERRRRLIFHALRPLLGEAQALQAVQIWEEEFHDKPYIIPSLFAQRLALALDVAPQLEEIRASLTRCMMMSLDDLVPISVSSPAQPAPDTAPAPERKLPEHIAVFNFLLSELTQRLAGQVDLSALRQALLQEMRGAGLSAAAVPALRMFAIDLGTKRSVAIHNGVSRQDMSRFLDLLYVWSCDALGPVATDRLFAEVLHNCEETLPEAQRFPPRRLF